MGLFFDEEKSSTRNRGDKSKTKKKVKRTTGKSRPKEIKDPCEVCGLYKKCLSPKMPYSGEGLKKVLVIAEAPGKTEDEQGLQLVSESDRILNERMHRHGLDLYRDTWRINAVNCRPPENRNPTKKEMKCCRPRIMEAIQELKPKIIWLIGGKAVSSFYMDRFSELGIYRWRKLLIPDKETNAYIVATLHPSAILHNKGDRNLSSVYDRDMDWVCDQINLDLDRPTFPDYKSKVRLLTNYNKVVKYLENIINTKPMIAYDYETTNIKPFDLGQRIWSIAVAYKGKAIAFPFKWHDPDTGDNWWNKEQYKKINSLWRRIIQDPDIKKIAHNSKFEEMWTREIMKVIARGWHWCTMNTAHILDERKRYVGLKFQTYINFGIEGYDAEVKPYIKTKPGDNINRLNHLPLKSLLLYNGLDALFTLKLYITQRRQIMRSPMKEAFTLFHEGLSTLMDVQETGIEIDELFLVEAQETLQNKLDKIEKKLLRGSAAKKFKKHTGRPLEIVNKDFGIADLRILLFEVLKQPILKKTGSNLASVDKEVLEKIDIPFTRLLKKRRQLYKLKNTYLVQFTKTHNNRVHPFIDLHTTRSYRSSSSDPNIQNQPYRDPEAAEIIRRCIIPSPGRQLGCIDYGGIEVKMAGCCSRDPILCQEIVDDYDMHGEQAKNIFVLSDSELSKMLRFYAKNQFVFPQFYGSYWWSCANNIWQNAMDIETADGITALQHMINKGVITNNASKETFVLVGRRRFKVTQQIADLAIHIKSVEKIFWEKYARFREWQNEMVAEFQRMGYIEMFFGFRRGGILSNNQIFNTKIQGAAFHCLLWSMTRLNEIKHRKFKSDLIAEIHDEVMWDMEPRETDEILATSKDVMCNKIRDRYEWIIVPLAVEAETTQKDEAWFYKKEVEI